MFIQIDEEERGRKKNESEKRKREKRKKEKEKRGDEGGRFYEGWRKSEERKLSKKRSL